MLIDTQEKPKVNSLQQKFIEELTEELFSGSQASEPQKLCFQLRFNPQNWNKKSSTIAEEISKRLNGGFREGSIAPTVSEVVKKLKEKFEARMREDGVAVDLLELKNRGKRRDDKSPWRIVYNWLWNVEFPRRGWDLSKKSGICAKEELQMMASGTSGIVRRDVKIDIPKVGENAIQKEEKYLLQVDLKQAGYLLLINQGTSGTKYLWCPSKVYAPLAEMGATAPIYLPQQKALVTTPITFDAVGKEFFLAIVTEQPVNLSWVRPDSNPEDEWVINEERLREVFRQLAQQPTCQVFYKTFAVIERLNPS